MFYFFGQLVDGLLSFGWVNGGEVEIAKIEIHPSIRHQLQVEQSGSVRALINDVFSFYCGQSGLRSRRHLCRVGV